MFMPPSLLNGHFVVIRLNCGSLSVRTVQPFLSRTKEGRERRKSRWGIVFHLRESERETETEQSRVARKKIISGFFEAEKDSTPNFRNFESISSNSKFRLSATNLFVRAPRHPGIIWNPWSWDMLSEWRRHLKVWHFVESRRSRKEGGKMERRQARKAKSPSSYDDSWISWLGFAGAEGMFLPFSLSLENWGICLRLDGIIWQN